MNEEEMNKRIQELEARIKKIDELTAPKSEASFKDVSKEQEIQQKLNEIYGEDSPFYQKI